MVLGPKLGVAVASSSFFHPAFDPEVTHAMCVAFDMSCGSLGLSRRQDLVAEVLATKIIEAAAAGECDAARLHDAVMRWATPN
jgi:hypothetical protein